MNFKQCTICLNPFQSLGNKICGNCLTKIDESFRVIRDYLDEHPNSGVEEVSEETGIDEKIILHLLNENRLMLSEGKSPFVCDVCRRPIPSGKLCETCKNSLSKQLSSILPTATEKPKAEPDSKARGRMHGGR